jgi:hypothetical protein
VYNSVPPLLIHGVIDALANSLIGVNDFVVTHDSYMLWFAQKSHQHNVTGLNIALAYPSEELLRV